MLALVTSGLFSKPTEMQESIETLVAAHVFIRYGHCVFRIQQEGQTMIEPFSLKLMRFSFYSLVSIFVVAITDL